MRPFTPATPVTFKPLAPSGRAVNNAVIERRLSDRGVHLDNLSEVMRGVELILVKVTKTGESEENGPEPFGADYPLS